MFEELIKILGDKVTMQKDIKGAITLSKNIAYQKNVSPILSLLKNAPENSIDVVVCNQLMNKFNRNWDFICAVYNLLIAKQVANEASINSFITMAGKNRKFEAAKHAFEFAKTKKLINEITFNNVNSI